MNRPTVLVFVRSPSMGRCKTRLAKDIGPVEALRFYRASSAGVLRRLRSPRWRLVICLAGRATDPRWPALPIEDQGGGDLGARLARAIRRHATGKVVVVGSDVPDLDRVHVATALRRLRGDRAVLGPAADGGFWLMALGSRRARSIRLNHVRWSSPYALRDVIDELGEAHVLTQTLIDVDDGAALRQWREQQNLRAARSVELRSRLRCQSEPRGVGSCAVSRKRSSP